MSLSLALLFAAQHVARPALSPGDSPLRIAPDPTQLSLVIADTGTQSDPQPLCPAEECTALFLGDFSAARTIAGVPMARQFQARLEMGSPFNQSYRLVMVIEHRGTAEPLVRATRGFDARTGLACFADGEMRGIDWHPQADDIRYQGNSLCVAEPPRP